MRRTIRHALALLFIAGGGFLTGRWLSREPGSRFDVRDWSTRGSGPRLVEYFDPACPSCRMVHRRIDQILGAHPRLQHVLVPVAIIRGQAPPPADVLCAIDGEAAFTVASAWAIQPPGRPPHDLLGAERAAECAARVEAATLHTAIGSPDGSPQVPRVELEGEVFIGEESLPALEKALVKARS